MSTAVLAPTVFGATPSQSTENTQLFQFEDIPVRTLLIDNEPWFVLGDVCKASGLGQTARVKNRLDLLDITTSKVENTRGQMVDTVLVNESGLYDVILDSRKPQAKRFRRWVVNDILPMIRKTGGYVTKETLDDIFTDPSNIQKIVGKWKEAHEALEEANLKLELQQPKVDFAEAVEKSGKNIQLGDMAKMLNTRGLFDGGRNKFINLLKNQGFIMKLGTAGIAPTQRYINQGLLSVHEQVLKDAYGNDFKSSYRTDVTPKGQRYFIEKFKAGAF